MGAFLLFSSTVKLLDFEGFLQKAAYYRAVPYDWMIISAWATVATEFALGTALVAGVGRRIATVLTIALLTLFSALVAHAWAAYGITDCGCLGSAAETPPWIGLTKNAVIVSLLVICWPGRRLPEAGSASRDCRACPR